MMDMMLVRGIAILAVGLLGTSSARADVFFKTGALGVTDAFVSGDIQAKDVAEFASGVSGAKVLGLLYLNSNGGDVYAAMQIGRLVRTNNMSVAVPVPAQCLSSCSLIFIAGVERRNFGKIGLHRAYLVGAPQAAVSILKAVPKMVADIKRYVSDMGITDEFSNVMINTDPANMRVYDSSEIELLVPVRDPQFDELEVARAARKYGLTTQDYRSKQKYIDENCFNSNTPKSARPDFAAYRACTEQVLWGLGAGDWSRRSKKASITCKISDDDKAKLRGMNRLERQDTSIAIESENCERRIMRGG